MEMSKDLNDLLVKLDSARAQAAAMDQLYAASVIASLSAAILEGYYTGDSTRLVLMAHFGILKDDVTRAIRKERKS